MTDESHSTGHLINQSVVRFSSGSYTSHTYSNIVDTPVVGPVISILKKANTTEAVTGQIITYSLTISNKGNLDAQVTLFDNMPDGTAFIPNSVIVDQIPLPMARPDQGIPLGIVKVCETLEVTFQVIVLEQPDTLQLKNQASAVYIFHTAGGRKVTGSSKSNTVIIPFKQTKITFHKKASTSYTFVGDTVTFYFTIKNEETFPIYRVLFTDELPTGASFVPGSVKIGQVTYPSANPTEGIHIGEIPAKIELCIQFQISITSVPPSNCIINTGCLTYTQGDHRGKTTSNSVSLKVFDPALQVVESVLQPQATLGDTLTFTVTITNRGNIATDVWISDFIPNGSSYVLGSLTVDGVPYSQPLLPSQLPLGSLEPHKAFLVTFQVTVNSFAISPDQKQLIGQTAVLYTFQLPDERTVSNRILSNTVLVSLLWPILDIVLAASPLRAEPGSTISYRIVVANTGNLAANQISLLDWISPLNKLVPGSLRINGLVIPEVNVKTALSLGTVDPRSTIGITYEATIIHHPNARRITLRAAANYVYHVNEPIHSGTVLSNVVVIRIDHADE